MAGVIDLVSSDDEENPGTQEGDKAPLVAEPLVSLTPGGSVDGSGGGGSSSSLFHSSSGGVKNGNPEGGGNGQIPKGKGTIRAADDGSGGSELSPPPALMTTSPIDGGGGSQDLEPANPHCDTVELQREPPSVHPITGPETERKPRENLERGKSLLTASGSRGVSTGSSSRDPDVCRHFWRAGDYNAPAPRRQRPAQGSMDHVRVHPKFLHSNATSHKWALGAIAELLDNAIDEIENGATYVRVDKITNPRDGNPALLIQDDGGGMRPEGIRQCMSLGYSRKNTNTTIGQYGNGFKTSTMRLGADVIVFTRNSSGRVATQSIGLLSYTFLRKAGHEDIVVPMLDYQLSASGREPTVLVRSNMDDWLSNLATLMRWSPYATEVELLKQFNDIEWHGTKVIVFNLWLNDDGILELDFDSDEHDIQLRVGAKDKPGKQVNLPTQLTREHIVNRYRLSLRAYASILYLQMPPQFQIILRNLPVEHHSIAMDLKFCEYIVYKPQIGGNKDPVNKETSVITTIGFTKEAPMVNVHGFNVYHKNRLIMPFWKVFQDNSSRGRGVVGVLEANFIEPAHDKQDFERTTVFLRLEARLKAMTIEYWNLHCHLIGYQSSADKRNRKTVLQVEVPVAIPAAVASTSSHPLSSNLPVMANQNEPQTVTSLSPSTSDSSSQGEQLPDHSSSVATNLKRINGSLSRQQQPGMLFVPASGGTLRATSNSGRVSSSSNGRVTEGNNNPTSTAGAAAPATPPRVGVDAEIIILQDDDCVIIGEGTKFVSTKVETSKASEEQKPLRSQLNEEDSVQEQCCGAQNSGETLMATTATVKLEPVEAADNVLKRSALERQRSSDVLLPALKKLRVQEKEVNTIDKRGSVTAVLIPDSVKDVASGGCEGEVPGVSGTVLTVHRQNTATSMTGILEQNISLRAKCKEYEKREKDWEEKVAALERELAEHKVKYSLLQEQMRLVQAVRDNEDEGNTTQERFTVEERIPKLESEMEE